MRPNSYFRSPWPVPVAGDDRRRERGDTRAIRREMQRRVFRQARDAHLSRYKKACVAAAIAAAQAARTAGDNDDGVANSMRAAKACRAQDRCAKARARRSAACLRDGGGRGAASLRRPTALGDPCGGRGRRNHRPGRRRDRDLHAQSGPRTGLLQRQLDLPRRGHRAPHPRPRRWLDRRPAGRRRRPRGRQREGLCDRCRREADQGDPPHPDQYYVNVHSDEFPSGAIRGTLHA